MEESSTELTEICEGLYLASVAGLELSSQEGEFTVITVGSDARPGCRNINLHIELSQEGDITTHHLQSVNKVIAETK